MRGGSQEEPEGELTPEEVDILIGAALPGDEGLRFAPVAAALPACHRAARHATAWTG